MKGIDIRVSVDVKVCNNGAMGLGKLYKPVRVYIEDEDAESVLALFKEKNITLPIFMQGKQVQPDMHDTRFSDLAMCLGPVECEDGFEQEEDFYDEYYATCPK